MVDLSAVVLTRNRPERCLDSVWHNVLAMQGLRAEMIVVNNGSEEVPLPRTIAGISCRVLQMPENLGAAARNEGISRSAGRHILILDDDSYMDPGLVEMAAAELDRSRGVGAASFRVQNGDREEACLLPTVFHGCACMFRREALLKVGGYPKGYLYYGEEYDLAFRLYKSGYSMVICDGRGRVRHARDSSGRDARRIISLLLRNNTYLVFSFFPLKSVASAMRDIFQRYKLVARKESAEEGYAKGLRSAPAAALRGLLNRRPLTAETFEKVTLLDKARKTAEAIASAGVAETVVCGVGKLPTLWINALTRAGLKIVAFWDTNTCWLNQRVQGIPVEVVADDSPLPQTAPNVCRIVGMSSLAESAHWRKRISAEGKMSLILREPLAPPTEALSAPSGTIDLLDACYLSVFGPEKGLFSRVGADGMRPATTALHRTIRLKQEGRKRGVQ